MSSWSISHDFFFQLGGAERVTAHLAAATGATEVVAIAGDRAVEAGLGLGRVRHTGGRGYTAENYRARALARPVLELGRRPLPGNVLSSSYAFAHHVRAEGTHLVYCHSPLRQIWSGTAMYGASGSARAIAAVAPALRYLDRAAARRADGYIATNEVVARRVRAFYGIEPLAIVPPPVEDAFFVPEPLPATRRQRVVWAGRIVEPYKRLSLVIDAVRALPDVELLVAGDGRDRARLEAGAPDNVRFLGAVDTAGLAELYATASCLVFPSEDDFGMVPIEAMAAGTPVVAFRGGGATETVVDGYTGVFFDEPTAGSLRAALLRSLRTTWDHGAIAAGATQWSAAAFAERIRSVTAGVAAR